jgi:hypothetical protein
MRDCAVLDRNAQSRATIRWLALVLVVLASGCSGSLFKVKPVVELPALPSTARSADAGGVVMRVAPLLTDEESQELFEANLPLSGLLPVRIELNYETGGVPLELKGVRFHLHDGAGRMWKTLPPKQAISRLLKTNGVSLYNPHSRKEFEKEFTAYAVDLKTPLPAAERRRQGFLFFQTPDKRMVSSPPGLVLAVDGLPRPVEIKLN